MLNIKTSLFTVIALAFSHALVAQSTTAVIEAGQVFANNGDALSFSSTLNGQSVVAFHGVTSKSIQELTTDFSSLDASALQADFGQFTWTQMSSSANSSVEWINSQLATPVGSRAIVAIMNASGPSGIVSGTQVALLAAPTGPVTLENVTHAFGAGINAWNVILGTEGSVTLAVAVPEPSVYAALLGLGALGFVMWRRRRN